MRKIYTNLAIRGNNILYRGYDENNQRVSEKIEFSPTLYVSTSKPSEWKTLDGKYVEPVKPGTMSDTRDFIKQYSDVDGFNMYGMERFELQYIGEEFPEEHIDIDISRIRVAYLDIETESEQGFPNVEDAQERVNAITISLHGRYYTFGLQDIATPEGTIYKYCETEEVLLASFLDWWEEHDIDILTGWNVKLFDFTYLVNRVRNVLGEQSTKRFSPWGILKEKEEEDHGRTVKTYEAVGMSVIDYMMLYRKFSYKTPESFRLAVIAEMELGESKISYEEFGSIKDFYKKDYSQFIKYNIHDVKLVERLEKKLKIMELLLFQAYYAKVNYEDIMGQLRTWDAIFYYYLNNKKIAVPLKQDRPKTEQFIGAYVKDPNPGFKNWVVSFDFASLYPSIILQNNLSTETLVNNIPEGLKHLAKVNIDDLLESRIDTTKLSLHDLVLAANGVLYRKDIRGFMPTCVEMLMNQRKEYKKKMLQAKKDIEKINDELKRRGQ